MNLLLDHIAYVYTGRRATQVALVSYSGRVVNFKGTFGFLEYDPSRGSAAAAAGASAPNGTEKAADKGTEKGGEAPNGAPAAQSGVGGEEGGIAADGASPSAGTVCDPIQHMASVLCCAFYCLIVMKLPHRPHSASWHWP